MFGRFTRAFMEKVSPGNDRIPIAQPIEKDNSTCLFKQRGTFYRKPTGKQAYEPITDIGGASLMLTHNNDYFIEVVVPGENDEDEMFFQQALGTGINMTYYHKLGAIMWYCMMDEKVVDFCFRFELCADAKARGLLTVDSLSKMFIEVYHRCAYLQFTSGVEPDKDNEDDFNYITEPLSQQVTMRESSPDPSDNQTQEAVFEFETSEDRGRSVSRKISTGKNVCLSNSILHHRAIVLHETSKDGCLEAQSHLWADNGWAPEEPERFEVTELKGVTAKHSLLSLNERSMYIHTYGKGHNGVAKLDMEAGEVVEEYKPPENYKIVNIVHQNRTAECDPNLISCLSEKVAFSIDTRLNPDKCVVAEVGKGIEDYQLSSLKTAFCCHATSQRGHLVIGDLTGDIRLYSGTPGSMKENGKYNPKTAKTLLKTTGEEIKDIDITNNGDYVVAASKERVLVFPLKYIDSNGTAVNGCETKMGKKKPTPLSLTLDADQLNKLRGEVNFSRVRFEYTKEGEEELIVATSGKYIITWSMASVIRALEDNSRVNGSIVAENERVTELYTMREGQGGPTVVTFLTDGSVGMERAVKEKRMKCFSYFSR